METQQNNHTPLPSEEQPWMQYYPEEVRNSRPSQCTEYEYLHKCNGDYPNDVAMIYESREVTNQTLFENIDLYSNGLAAYHLAPDDAISLYLLGTPEVFALYFAANKLGIATNFPDQRLNPDDFRALLRKTRSKFIFISEIYYSKHRENLEGLNEPLVVVPDIHEGSAIEAKCDPALETPPNIIRWEKFIADCKAAPEAALVPFDASRVAVMYQTGGSTGSPKNVLLSNENLNVVNDVATLLNRNGSIALRKARVKYLNPLPSYITMGFNTPLFYLYMGAIIILTTDTALDHYADAVAKWKPNLLYGVPSRYENLMNSPKLQAMDLSFIYTCAGGGDVFTQAFLERVNTFLADHHSRAVLTPGYGSTEASLGISGPIAGKTKPGSLGAPYPFGTMGVFKPGTDEELTYDEEGELCITGPIVMLGYLDDPEETNKVIRTHSDGRRWLHTGDLGRIDADGFLFITGRIKRMFKRTNGAHVYPSEIDQFLQGQPSVRMSATVGKPDPLAGTVPVSFVVLKPGEDKAAAKTALLEACKRDLPEIYVPVDLIVCDSFPMTKNDKVDERALLTSLEQSA